MALQEIIKQRKSIRDFSTKPVEEEKIRLCLEAARLAPSACNSQPWHFIIVNNKLVKDNLCRAAFGGIYFINSFAKTAPVIVVVVSERSKFIARIGAMFRDTRYYLIDIGVACEHFILQAEELGLGTCWIGWFNERALKPILNIPKREKVDILIALGYYDRKKLGVEHNRESLSKIASFNSFPK